MAYLTQIKTLIRLPNFRREVLNMFVTNSSFDSDEDLAEKDKVIDFDNMETLFYELPGCEQTLVEILCEQLTQKEADEMIAFYASDCSRKLQKLRPVISRRGLSWGFGKMLERLDAELEEEA